MAIKMAVPTTSPTVAPAQYNCLSVTAAPPFYDVVALTMQNPCHTKKPVYWRCFKIKVCRVTVRCVTLHTFCKMAIAETA